MPQRAISPNQSGSCPSNFLPNLPFLHSPLSCWTVLSLTLMFSFIPLPTPSHPVPYYDVVQLHPFSLLIIISIMYLLSFFTHCSFGLYRTLSAWSQFFLSSCSSQITLFSLSLKLPCISPLPPELISGHLSIGPSFIFIPPWLLQYRSHSRLRRGKISRYCQQDWTINRIAKSRVLYHNRKLHGIYVLGWRRQFTWTSDHWDISGHCFPFRFWALVILQLVTFIYQHSSIDRQYTMIPLRVGACIVHGYFYFISCSSHSSLSNFLSQTSFYPMHHILTRDLVTFVNFKSSPIKLVISVALFLAKQTSNFWFSSWGSFTKERHTIP